MTDIERLLAIEDIKRLKARYFRCVDTKDWNTFRTLFTADAAFDIRDDVPGCLMIGPDAIASAASGPLEGCISVHHGHCPEIDILSDVEAQGIWAMEDILRWSADSALPGQTLHGFGHYFERYAKADGAWRISALKLQRLRVDVGGST
ncbi:hypothetical protein FHS96_003869 [Sphingomonas zeicaulis]|uniref:nuclear transport factor 2 family protein n=1 Tax=Sphingomonas zeicaulis TaxID=1632740 RepID=UPI003D1ED560